MAKHRSGYISIDITDYINEISDDDLLEEVRDRKLTLSEGSQEVVPEDEICDAYHELLVGRPEEARAILERLVKPKWGSVRNCEVDYAAARKLGGVA